MTFRMPLPLGTQANAGFHAAGDGQMGGIMKVYREWLLSGDDDWLKSIWTKVEMSLEYAWKHWDMDKDGVMEGVQHNTYDIEFHGPNTMMGSFILALSLRLKKWHAILVKKTKQTNTGKSLKAVKSGWTRISLMVNGIVRKLDRRRELLQNSNISMAKDVSLIK